jgi:signal transduction histidine kinase
LVLLTSAVDYSADDVQLVTSYAAQAAVALTNARLYGELTQKVELLRRVHEVSQALTEPLDLDEMFRRITAGVRRGLNLHHVLVYIIERDHNVLCLRMQAGGEKPAAGPEYDLTGHVLGRIALSEHRYVWLTGLAGSDVLAEPAIATAPTGYAALPLRSREGPLGLLVVHVANGQEEISTAETLESLALFADYAGLAIAHALHSRTVEMERAQRVLIAAEERTRRDVAEMLHGRVQTRLLVAWHRLSQCGQLLESDPAQVRALLQQVAQEIDRVREEDVRNVSHLLHPGIINVGLLPALHSLLAQTRQLMSVTFTAAPEVVALDNPAENGIHPDVRLVVYRVLEEALANAYRHGKATAVTVTLALAGRRLRLQVSDNGCGFAPADRPAGIGFQSIAARAGQVGGAWQVQSSPEAGTTLTLWVPTGGAAASEEQPA